jgi:hypothetical protein
MRPWAWLRLLRDGKFRIHPARLPLATIVSIVTIFNVLLGSLQKLLYRQRLATAELHGPPVFVVGHWRSGTTLLHELLILDERLSSPSTLQCFAPHHFLISEWFFRRFAGWLLPRKRPMDNMQTGWERPQEDEFALLALGMNSPYRRMAFPNQPAPDLEYLDFAGLTAGEIQAWLDSLRSFLVTVSIATGRPLVVKSPTHTGRIEWLAREFPDAKFIHITRDPRDLFPSTCRLWKGLDDAQALQIPTHKHLESYVIECLQRMYRAFEVGRQSLGPQRLIDVRYDDLVADPVATMKMIYETLHLSDFETVAPTLRQWVETEHQHYKTNQHQLDAATELRLREAWQDYFEQYGY